LPFKLNADRRHHIPKQTLKVTNWAAYDASLCQRGSLTVWVTGEAIAAWTAEPRTTRGGQRTYSSLAILTALTLRAVFRLALRQIESLIGSVIGLLGLDLAVPDHSTMSRRAETLEVPRPKARASGEPVHLLVDRAWFRICHFSVTQACEDRRPVRAGFDRKGVLCGRRPASPGQARWG